MRALTTPPSPDDYRFVLRRCTELDPCFAELFVCRGEPSKQSRDIMHADGKRRRTIFITTKPVRERAVRLGWEDVTAMFANRLAGEKPVALPSRMPEPIDTADAVVIEPAPGEESTEPPEAAVAKPKSKPKPGARTSRAATRARKAV